MYRFFNRQIQKIKDELERSEFDRINLHIAATLPQCSYCCWPLRGRLAFTDDEGSNWTRRVADNMVVEEMEVSTVG